MTNEEWKAKWTGYCRSCSGWGGHVFYESHGFAGGGAEQMVDPCAHCIGADDPKCGRCGAAMTIEDAEEGNPCGACGWNMDDGLTEDPDCGYTKM